MEELIKNEARLKQVIDFTGMTFGKVQPSDIDAYYEIDDEFLVLFEVKYGNTMLSGGQKLGFTRMVSKWNNAIDSSAIGLVVEHRTKVHERVILNDCIVRSTYNNGKWYNIRKKNIKVKDVLQMIAHDWNIYKLKRNISIA